ncbi:hypothetical protein [uncultured Methanobrevibacter sp.]|uniref:hypothetical protein n=1 Tax=uncultured Methanobrevibacter sp. TaxID=253161 RepID=UPI0026DEB292|nr:hypothetical protein [uncultured Methanobrevibacter sp.]
MRVTEATGLDAGNLVGFGPANVAYVVQVKLRETKEEKLQYIKRLWLSNPKDVYEEWKEWCIYGDSLPDIFGTHDNPIPIDESKL